MNHINNATIIRRELIIKLAKLFFEDNLKDIDRIPLEMAPKHKKAVNRCCIHKERAVMKYRLMAMLGYLVEDEQDELTPLSEYAEKALHRDSLEAPILTVVDEACSTCHKTAYFVTNACRGCVARPCMMNCKKNAIEMIDGQARIDSSNCVNCGLCMQECPYHAIIKIPIPCEEACPVGAISRDENGHERIDFSKCTFCGKCMRECPFSAIMERSQLIDILKHITSKGKIIAMVAPAIVGQFSAEFGQLITAIKGIGFDDVVEVSYGAEMTARHEAEEFSEMLAEGNRKFMTTSCCPAYTETVNKHVPKLSSHVSTTPSPMHYTAEYINEIYPDALKVFIGPCVAKRNEALHDKEVDYVLTIEELGGLFIAKGIDVQKCDETVSEHSGKKAGRGFPVTGGVSCALKSYLDDETLVDGILIDGLDKKSLRELKSLPRTFKGNFVEVMACEGGCLNGPKLLNKPKLAQRSLNKLLSDTEE